MENKTCQVCRTEKNPSEFWKNKAEKDGLQRKCKDCCRAYNAPRKEKHKLYMVAYNRDNFDRIAAQKKEYASKDPEKWSAYYATYDSDNKERKRPLRREWQRKRRSTDLNFLIKGRLGARLSAAIRKEWKAGSAVRDLGCSIPEFRQHIESKFQTGMTWGNWGKGHGFWNIDHIMPISAFDLTNRQHVVVACHHLNLQPLWFEDNMSKGCKVDF